MSKIKLQNVQVTTATIGDYNTVHVTNNDHSKQVFERYLNVAQGAPTPELQTKLSQLVNEVAAVHPSLSGPAKGEAEEQLGKFLEEARQEPPKKEQLKLSGEGLITAAETCAAMAGPVIITVKAVLGLFGVSLP